MNAKPRLRVLDFTRVLAGPVCTMLLGDYGADVIKVERPGRGDDTRHWGPPWAGSDAARLSAYFLSVNRNKRSLTLNLQDAEGRALARRLALASDVLIENFRVGQMAAWGLDYDSARRRTSRPRLLQHQWLRPGRPARPRAGLRLRHPGAERVDGHHRRG